MGLKLPLQNRANLAENGAAKAVVMDKDPADSHKQGEKFAEKLFPAKHRARCWWQGAKVVDEKPIRAPFEPNGGRQWLL